MATLEVTGLGISFGGLRAVDDLTMSIEKGGLVGLIGPNGAGKTTVFNMLTGVYRPTDGGIRLNGENLIGKSLTKSTAWALPAPSRTSDCSRSRVFWTTL